MTTHIVVGGQFGSEGKGAFTKHLTEALTYANRDMPPMAVRTGGPNAGHTVWFKGEELKLRHIPASAVIEEDIPLCIAAGAEIDLGVLEFEIEVLEKMGLPIQKRLFVDRSATLIGGTDKINEHALIGRIGSTGKGVGAARSRRIWREADLYGGDVDVADRMRLWQREGGDIIIEGTQGYGLGLHTKYYPKCTSRDCTAIDFLAECGHYPLDTVVWVICRPHVIRVAGDSGPLLDETTWADLGLEEEYTTVTQKVRRVGGWDAALVRDALVANGPTAIPVLMQFDYVAPEIKNYVEPDALLPHLHVLDEYERSIGSPIGAVGTGPDSLIWRKIRP